MQGWMKWAAAALAAGVLLGCGGGGSGGGAVSQGPDGSDTGSQLPAATLSENQRLFEEFTLAGNGGQYLLSVGISLPQQGPLISGATASKFELPSSPAGVASGVQAVYTPEVVLMASPYPYPEDSDANPNFGSVALVDGQLLFYPLSTAPRVTYRGDDIVTEMLTASGQVASGALIKSHSKVPLTGALADAPEEFRRMFAFDPSHVNMTATFAPGAAYYKQVVTVVGDHVAVADWDSDPNVDPKSATPVATGTTLAAFVAGESLGYFPYEAADGAIRTLNGAKCWVRNTPIQGTRESAFTAFCSIGTNVYWCRYRPDGSSLGSVYPTVANVTRLETEPFTVRLNEAAINSMKAMFH